MQRVTGLGGVFYRAREAQALRAFYRERLGLEIESYGGATFSWRDARDASRTGTTTFALFDDASTYFAPSESRVMVSFRVEDLDALRAELRAAGVRVEDAVEVSEFGRFGWAHDPEGNKIELWEPPATERAGQPFWVVDAFTSEAFKGNPAAVCPLEAFLEDTRMRDIARENALSETAFLVRRESPDDAPAYDLRWFTPAVEVDLCGHATLASAHVVFTELTRRAERVTFHTKSGPLEVTREGAALTMRFPARPPIPHTPSPVELAAVVEALGRAPVALYRGTDAIVARLEAEADVTELAPDMGRVAALDVSCVIVTAPGGSGVDFVSRFFAPRKGVPEDPVTGSAHCTLAPLWAERLGKTELSAAQRSARGGTLRCRVDGDAVFLTGEAVLTKRGVILAV